MKTIYLHIESPFYNRIAYVLAFLQYHPLSPSVNFQISNKNFKTENNIKNCISIFYNKNKINQQQQYFIPAQHLIFNKNITNSQALFANQYAWKNQLLHSVEQEKQSLQPFFNNKTFGFDLLETIFFHLSRYEECYASADDGDEYDMLQESKHFLVRHQLYQQPVLDDLVYAFFEALNLQPLKKTTHFQLSHDIDSVCKLPSFYRFARAATRLILDKQPLCLIKLTQQYVQIKMGVQKDPFDVFDWFLIENKKVKKVIYFMAGGKTRYENFYKIEQPKVLKIIEQAKELGYEIGLHPSYLTWKNKAMFQQELTHLEKVVGEKVRHSRQHFLHCSFAETFDILEDLGIENDSTLGYQNLIGFRCGTGFDFHLYNFKKEQAYGFKETPMIVMDCALLAMTNNEVLSAEQLLKYFLNQNKFNTKITFNFHNHIFDEAKLDNDAMKHLYDFIRH